MASRKRALIELTKDWQQLQFHLDWRERHRWANPTRGRVRRTAVERAQHPGIWACRER